MEPLEELLTDWVDWDVAAYSLSQSLGLLNKSVAFQDVKHAFWSNHPTGKALQEMLDLLTQVKVLQRREDPDIQYRWSGDLKSLWGPL